MGHTSYNPYESAKKQFNQVADQIGLDSSTRELLSQPSREYHFTIPVKMDDGTTKVFNGYRIQHNDARGPAKEEYVSTLKKLWILSVLFPCG